MFNTLRILYKFFLLWIALISVHALQAQFQQPYFHFSKETGLPSNLIYNFVFDKEGFLWLGTDAGLVKFDGKHVKVFTSKNGLPSNDLFLLYCDRENRVWISTMKDEVCYIKNGQIRTSENDSILKQFKGNKHYFRYLEDSENNMWFLSSKGDYYKLDKDQKISHFTNTTGMGFLEFQKKIYFFSLKGGVYAHDILTNERKLTTINTANTIKIKSIVEWNGGLYYVDNQNKLAKASLKQLLNQELLIYCLQFLTPIQDSNIFLLTGSGYAKNNLSSLKQTDELFSGYYTSKLGFDDKKNTWIGTHGDGLYQILNTQIKNFYPEGEYRKINFYSLYKDENYLIAGDNNSEIFIFNACDLKLIKRIKFSEHGVFRSRILSIVSSDHDYFVGGDHVLAKINKRNLHYQMLKTFQGAIKNLYTDQHALNVLGNSFFNSMHLKNMHESSIWRIPKKFYSTVVYQGKRIIGTEDSLYVLHQTKDTTYLTNYRSTLKDWATDLTVYDSLLLVSTSDRGIVFLNGTTEELCLNESNGLSSNYCHKMQTYKHRLYVATNNGISIYDFKSRSFSYLFASQGLPSNNVNDIKIHKDTLYAATEEGISVIPISEIQKTNKIDLFSNPLFLNQKQIEYDGKSIKCHLHDNLQIQLNALWYSSSSHYSFYYRLKGLENSFTKTSDQIIRLKISNSGNYQFEAYVQNSEGVKSGKIILPIEVIPWWYQTMLFKFLAAFGMLLLLFLLIRFLIKRESIKMAKRNELELKLKNVELEEWKTSINPHFLFNSLNTIQSLFSSKEFEKGNSYLSTFSKILRRNVDSSGKLLIKITDEISFLHQYLSLEKMKKEDGLYYSIRVSDNFTTNIYLPSLVLQPIVENSLKHGINENEDTYIHIQMDIIHQQLVITITDNGKGMKHNKDERNSMGLELVQTKLNIFSKITGYTVGFEYGNQLDAENKVVGFKTTIILPLLFNEHEFDQNNYYR